MRWVNGVKLLLLGTAAIGLVACATSGSKKARSGMNGQGDEAAAKTYAINAGPGYKARRNSAGEIINPLRAPANQTYYFNFDSNKVRAEDYRALMVQAKYLIKHPNVKIRLEGNADNRGSREYNIGLGWRRDQAIARVLEQRGVAPAQINMVSYGKERPAIFGNNERSWHLNRRVRLVYEAT